ncbi:MAG: amidohydrolase [Acidobacteria bacterium]|nr:MAG: amidohydrolase [Acidobacteriota bacterium]
MGDEITLILLHGNVWTGSLSQPHAEALAIAGTTIAALGTNAEIESLAPAGCPRLDLAGRRVLPGFNDAHVHFYMGGAGLAGVQLRTARSAEEFRDRLAAFAKSVPEGEWILGGFWDEANWEQPELPTRDLVDDVTPRHPVFVRGMAGHMSFANSLALRLARAESTPDVPGGVIVRDAQGRATGVLMEAAQTLVERAIPVPSVKQVRGALLAAQRHALTHGVTSIQDMGVVGSQRLALTGRILQVYQDLLHSGELQMRVSFHLPLPEFREHLDAALSTAAGQKLRVDAIKSFSDGGLGSSTAWFLDDYSHRPGWRGLPSEEMSDPKTMLRNLFDADRAGLRLAVHAIGDRANRTVLDMYAALATSEGYRDRRWRIEHAQHLHPDDIGRFAELGVIASVQPYHCMDDARWAEAHIGPERAKGTYAFRSLLDAGARLACGSDWFVAPLDPLAGLYAAVTRRVTGASQETWHPEQAITLTEALHGYTSGSAFASGEESVKGTLSPGKLADLVVLSSDIFVLDAGHIRDVQVELTICNGEVVYQREAKSVPA